MALTPGTRLGPYEVLSALGAGGMGEVYKARDSRLTRTVAIKVLPAHSTADLAARARFEREARAIATLSHPHICVVFDVGSQGDIDYLVMELLEGETLADRLAKTKGPPPLDQVLSIGVAIADALDKAHRAGIVHRDLKPANVMLTKTGPKLLDFGLAKLHGAASPVALSDETAATTAGPRTAKGTILGTIHYMAPEQVEGREADPRADIWALGALLYEMATGHRPFEGDSAASVIGAILKDTPPALSTRQPLTPPAFEHLVERCLEKDPDARWQSVRDVRGELQWLGRASARQASAPVTAIPGSSSPAGRVWMTVAVGALIGMAAMAVPVMRHLRESPPTAPLETRLEINTPAASNAMSFALSPDGRQIVFPSSTDGVSRLWLRPLASTTAHAIQGTEGATYPFWSPDGRSIGFFASDALKRVDVGGGVAQTLAPALSARGGSWNSDGVILFSPNNGGPLLRVPASGGKPVPATTHLERQTSHRFPSFLPDGQHFLFIAQGDPEVSGVYLGALDGSVPHRLTPSDSGGVMLPSGWLLWVQSGALVARQLDLANGVLIGETATLAEGVAVDDLGVSVLSATRTGLIAYRPVSGSRRRLVWVDPTGAAVGTIGNADESFKVPRVAPDGRRVIVNRTVQGNDDLWLLDGARMSRFTFDPVRDDRPVWSPDGTTIVFRSRKTGGGDLYQKLASGAGDPVRVLASDQTMTPGSWSSDGRFIAYTSNNPQTNTDIWMLPMTGDRKPVIFLRTPFREVYPAFSPDGRWVAYQSNESGRNEVYVRAFAPAGVTGGQWQVSTSGGLSPAWRPDGKALYYLNPASTMMMAPIRVSGDTLEPGTPAALFQARIVGGGVDTQQGRQFDVAADGRFLINTPLDDVTAPLTVIQNWNPDAMK